MIEIVKDFESIFSYLVLMALIIPVIYVYVVAPIVWVVRLSKRKKSKKNKETSEKPEKKKIVTEEIFNYEYKEVGEMRSGASEYLSSLEHIERRISIDDIEPDEVGNLALENTDIYDEFFLNKIPFISRDINDKYFEIMKNCDEINKKYMEYADDEIEEKRPLIASENSAKIKITLSLIRDFEDISSHYFDNLKIYV